MTVQETRYLIVLAVVINALAAGLHFYMGTFMGRWHTFVGVFHVILIGLMFALLKKVWEWD